MAPAFDPERHHRGSIRLPGHDYATAGAYFVTICVHDRSPRFGEIANGFVYPTVAGLMVESWWGNIERRFPTVMSGPYVVMPNHFHGIVMLGAVAGSDIVDRGEGGHSGPPLQTWFPNPIVTGVYDEFVGAARRGRPASDTDDSMQPQHRKPPSLPEIIGWFKSATTHDYGIGVQNFGWPPYNRRLWQRGYYDHVIRNEIDLQRIEAYIHNNPTRWMDDLLNPDRP